MSKILHLNDGTRYVLASPAANGIRKSDFKRMLLEKLGKDAANEFVDICNEVDRLAWKMAQDECG